MYSKIKSGSLIAFICFFTACNDSKTTTETENKDTSVQTHTDTTAHEHNVDANANNVDMMGAMNSSMNRMHSMKMTGDFDTDWANMMAEHHQGAIDMAQIELSQGKDEKMKAKAQEIITKQKEEQAKLRDLANNLKPSDMKMGEGELEKSMSAMMDKMKSMQMSGNVDKDFATMMIQHHEDGVSMFKKEVANGMNGDLKKIAKNGIADQQKEINEFKSWLKVQK